MVGVAEEKDAVLANTAGGLEEMREPAESNSDAAEQWRLGQSLALMTEEQRRSASIERHRLQREVLTSTRRAAHEERKRRAAERAPDKVLRSIIHDPTQLQDGTWINLHAGEKAAKWKAQHSQIRMLESAADSVLDRVLARQREYRARDAKRLAQQQAAQQRLQNECAEQVAEFKSHRRAREAEREKVWQDKLQADKDAEVARALVSSQLTLRLKQTQLKSKIELLRLEAVHRAHKVNGQLASTTVTSDQQAMDKGDAARWLAISEIPAHRLVYYVFECIDVDQSGTLSHSEILGSKFGARLAPQWTALDPDGDGEVSLEEWMSFFDDLRFVLCAEFESFMVDLVWQSGVSVESIPPPNSAAAKIQAKLRGKRVRRAMQLLNRCALRLQCAYRSRVARKRLRAALELRAAVRIQSQFRAARKRRELARTSPASLRDLTDRRAHIFATSDARNAFENAQKMLAEGLRAISSAEQGKGGTGAPKSYDKMRTRMVINAFEDAMELGYPRLSRCFVGCGLAYARFSKPPQWREAFVQFSRAIDADSNDSRSYSARAEASLALANLSQAQQDALMARKLMRRADPSSIREAAKKSQAVSVQGQKSQHCLDQELWEVAGGSAQHEYALTESKTDCTLPEQAPKEMCDPGSTTNETFANGPTDSESRDDSMPLANMSRKDRHALARLQEAQLHRLQQLIVQGANPNFAQRGLTVLGRAVVANNLRGIEELLAADANPETAAMQRRYKSCGCSALMLAAQQGHVDAMRILLGSGADLEFVSEVDGSCIWSAAITQKQPEVEALLRQVKGPAPGGAASQRLALESEWADIEAAAAKSKDIDNSQA